jgi:hypothetical protein
MTAIAPILRELIAAGLSGEALVEAVERIELASQGAAKERSSAALRQERYRQRKASQTVTSDARDVTSVTNVTPEALPPAPPSQVNPPSQKTPKGVQKGSTLPADWVPTAASVEKGLALGLTDEQVVGHSEDFRLWAGANANRAVAKKLDWEQAFDGWVRRAVRATANAKPKLELSMDAEYRTMLEHYPKAEKPLGTADVATREAYARARKVAEAKEILAGIIGYAKEVKSRPKERQQMVPALGKFLDEHRWKNYHAKTPTAGGIPEELWRRQIENFKSGRQWPMALGPAPGYSGCTAPRHLLDELGYGTKTDTAMSG